MPGCGTKIPHAAQCGPPPKKMVQYVSTIAKSGKLAINFEDLYVYTCSEITELNLCKL